MRAAAAKGGIYGNDGVEAMYPLTRVDAKGETARRQQAQLHAHLPRRTTPARQCLLVGDHVRRQEPAPDQKSDQPLPHQLADDAANEENADGSLTLYIQKDSPGKAKEPNWLPAPNDTIYLVMRLYWPKEKPPSVLPAGSGTWQPPAVVQAS